MENTQETESPATGVRPPQVLLSWTAPTHHNHDRSSRWYLISGLLVLAIAVYGIITGAWTVTLVTLLVGGLYFLVRKEDTPLKTIKIEIDGVEFQDKFTPWTECKDFWIVKTPLYAELHIMRKSGITGDIHVQTGSIDPTLIRSTLSQFVPMRADQSEHLFDVIIRLCKL